MKICPSLLLIAIAAVLHPILATPLFGAEGDWPMWRHDPTLSGHQPVPGSMTKEPRVLARHRPGASPGAATFADLLGSGKDAEVLALAVSRLDAYARDGTPLWQSQPRGHVLGHVEWVDDLDGDGRNKVVVLAWRLPLETAPSGIVTGDIDGDGQPDLLLGGQDGVLRALRDRGDRAERLWNKSFAGPVGTPLLADLNGDGKIEAVVSAGDGSVYVLGP